MKVNTALEELPDWEYEKCIPSPKWTPPSPRNNANLVSRGTSQTSDPLTTLVMLGAIHKGLLWSSLWAFSSSLDLMCDYFSAMCHVVCGFVWSQLCFMFVAHANFIFLVALYACRLQFKAVKHLIWKAEELTWTWDVVLQDTFYFLHGLNNFNLIECCNLELLNIH